MQNGEYLIDEHLVEIAETQGKDVDWQNIYYTTILDLDAQITLAETKAQLIMGACAILLAAIGFERGSGYDLFLNEDAAWGERLAFVLMLLTFGALIAAVFCALATARPNLRHPKHPSNLLFFSHIVNIEEHAYLERVLGMSAGQLKLYMMSQVYAKSVVIERKFRFSRYSLDFLFLAFLLWIIAQLVLAFVK